MFWDQYSVTFLTCSYNSKHVVGPSSLVPCTLHEEMQSPLETSGGRSHPPFYLGIKFVVNLFTLDPLFSGCPKSIRFVPRHSSPCTSLSHPLYPPELLLCHCPLPEASLHAIPKLYAHPLNPAPLLTGITNVGEILPSLTWLQL